MSGSPALEVDPDPDVWFVGPDDDRPLAAWLPEAVALVEATRPHAHVHADMRQYLSLVLTRIGETAEDDPLPYRAIAWDDLDVPPLVARYGMLSRVEAGEQGREILETVEDTAVEPPIVEDIGEDIGDIQEVANGLPNGTSVRRSVVYSDIAGAVLVEVRYVVDDGDPDLVAVLTAGERSTGRLIASLPHLDRLAASLKVVRG